jgi:hypothetical protein
MITVEDRSRVGRAEPRDGRSRATTYSPRKAAIAWVVSASLGWSLTIGIAWAIAQMF